MTTLYRASAQISALKARAVAAGADCAKELTDISKELREWLDDTEALIVRTQSVDQLADEDEVKPLVDEVDAAKAHAEAHSSGYKDSKKRWEKELTKAAAASSGASK